eukprot:CAMPEP_0201281758 /NCGR_PEP_ID=MMETSP1317-20130820/3974_1 /ASSEMBLY_ACC=CAM_ASM_000770 /TAXON_ID=187299 /ORGANISM="Undescribed Undescribed, Strain Undescribed" /LENGTH=91 /DNA_ID=CAMNT_0047592535 /DNA_START=2305 /DNA_END=2577 /DNA_ORIENTATION=+
MNFLNPSVVTTKPSGTAIPLGVKFYSISPRDAFFPPTVLKSLRSNSFKNLVALKSRHIWYLDHCPTMPLNMCPSILLKELDLKDLSTVGGK